MKLNFIAKPKVEQWGPIDSRILYPSFWFASTAGVGMKKWNVFWPEMIGLYEEGHLTFLWLQGTMSAIGIRAIKLWLLPDRKRKYFWKEYWHLVAALQKFARTIQKTPANKLKASQAKQWFKLLQPYWASTLVFEIANYGGPDFLRKALTPFVSEGQLESALEILLAPEKLSFHQQSELELFELGLKYAGDKKTLRKKLDHYAKQWYWVNNNYYESTPLGAGYFYKKILNLSKDQLKNKISLITKYTKGVKLKKQALKKRYRLPLNLMKQAEILCLSIWWQDHRKGFIWWSHGTTDILSLYLGAKNGIIFNDVMHYTAEEWVKLSAGKKMANRVLQERKKIATVVVGRGSYKVLTGAPAKKYAEKFVLFNSSSNKTTTLQGIVVSKTTKKVKAKVTVLLSSRDGKTMKKGNILVAPMTSPEYVPLMRLASAVITDVGGLMSHAAVVSRELGIPCIVNTKFATKILKTGDVVEVDVSKGTVKIIN